MINTILKEQEMTMLGVYENPSMLAGKIRGIDAIVLGNVISCVDSSLLGSLVETANIKIIDMNGGDIIMVIKYHATRSSIKNATFSMFSKWLVEQIVANRKK